MRSIIGHQKQKKYFNTAIANKALSHAYLFSGPEMIGKEMFALELYKLINNRNEVSENDPDIKIISPKTEEGETKIYIGDIREIKNFLSLKYFYGPYKMVLINDAHRMTDEAANSLLKILEEPSPESIFVLITSQPKSLLPTIISRCEPVNFTALSAKEMSEFLADKKIKSADKELLLAMAGGRIGWVSRIIDSDKIADVRKSVDEFDSLLKKDVSTRMQYAKKLYEKGEYKDAIAYWLNWCHVRKSYPTKIVAGLLKLNSVVSQPQFNHRLAIENFLINL